MAITWDWGVTRTIVDFDPTTGTIFIDWFSPEAIDVTETSGSTVFTMAGNNQTVTLVGVSLADLSIDNFTIMSEATGQEILAQVGQWEGPGDVKGPGGQGETADPGTPDEPQMFLIMPDGPSRVIEDFDPSKDMVHLQAGIIAERLVFADHAVTLNGETGLTIRVLSATGEIASETVLSGIEASDLNMSNFMVAEQSALNDVAGLLGVATEVPDNGGFDVVYDADGSNPPLPTGPSDLGGVTWAADFGADDIIGFNPAADAIDFGNASVHGLILTMTPDEEPVIDNPWGPDMQILQGVRLADLSIENFGVVGNEHLRQDLGGILSWEKGVGPRDPSTVYIRSHEYGQTQVIDGFDPSWQKISFLYFGTRERLSVEDTPDGMVISALPSGQSFTFRGVSKADLVPGNVEFHHDQVMEDNLEAAFGMSQDDVTLVSREALLTPQAPVGATTDGHQEREGVGDTAAPGPSPEGDDMPGGPQMPVEPVATDTISLGSGAQVVQVTWDWARVISVEGFDPLEDAFDFGSLGGCRHFNG